MSLGAHNISRIHGRYCIKTKGGLAEMDKPGACGKGQVYLEGAVDILRALDAIDFELLYSGRVSISFCHVTGLLSDP